MRKRKKKYFELDCHLTQILLKHRHGNGGTFCLQLCTGDFKYQGSGRCDCTLGCDAVNDATVSKLTDARSAQQGGLTRTPLVTRSLLIFLVGYFRDRTGTYDDMYRCLAGALLFLGAMWLAVVCCERRNLACVSTTRQEVHELGRKAVSPADNKEQCHM